VRQLKNYRLVVDLPPDVITAIETWFADTDAVASSRCITCGDWRRGFYAWTCERCQLECDHRHVSGIRRAGDGALHPCRRCLRCGLGTTPPRKGSELPNIIIRDTLDLYPAEPCARCGGLDGSQLHHWAPSAVFDDAEKWPTDWLCRNCHRIWHDAMRAAAGWRLDTKATAEPRDNAA
jgi:hypothetical protein